MTAETRLAVRHALWLSGVILGSAIGIVLVLLLAVRATTNTFVFQLARVEGKAMSPTIADQDRLIVDRLA